MASSLSNLSALLLNPYAQNGVQAPQSRGQIAPIKPGTSITARYTVEEDGELALRGVSVTPQKIGDATSEQTGAERRRQAPSYNFSDISKPRVALSPTDEITLFAPGTATEETQIGVPQANDPSDAGITEAVFEDIDSNDVAILNLAAQKQQRVAGLYARNADITYNINPVFSEAA